MPDLLTIRYYLALLSEICSLFPPTIMLLKKKKVGEKLHFTEFFEDLSLNLSNTIKEDQKTETKDQLNPSDNKGTVTFSLRNEDRKIIPS